MRKMIHYTQSEFLRSPCVHRAGTSIQWNPSDTYSQYNTVKDRVSYGPNDISYDFNNKGFRCDDFDLWEKYPYRIVFAGCSFTEGIGLPLEHTWAKIFHKKVCEKLGIEIPFWSVAKGGTGLDFLIRSLYNDCDILRPQIVISILPFLERRERWHDDDWAPCDGPLRNEMLGEMKLFLNERYITYQTEKNLIFLDLLLTKWDSLMLTMAAELEFDFQKISTSNIKYTDHYSTNIKDFARDGMHAGPLANAELSEVLFERFWPDIRLKFNIK